MRKYVIIVPDGAADHPLEELGGLTPLEAARLPNMDFIASDGACGTAVTVPEGLPAGSDVANLSLLGYDPRTYYCGRGPLEAASLGVEIGEGEYAFRCNLITVEDERIADYSAGHVSTGEARELMESVQAELGGPGVRFHPGMSYRHLMIIEGDWSSTACTPPHDVVGSPLAEVEPRGPGAERLVELIDRSREVLEDHPVNRARREAGKHPANRIWFWGQGRNPAMPTLKERYGLSGAVITAVDLIRGLGILAGMDPIEVPGATGYLDTDYDAKARYAAQALKEHDLVYIHVEAPDEAGHEGLVEEKVKALENIDRCIVCRMLDEAPRFGEDFRILVIPDHPTPIPLRTHIAEPVPFALYYPGIKPDGGASFSETGVAGGSWRGFPAWDLLELLTSD